MKKSRKITIYTLILLSICLIIGTIFSCFILIGDAKLDKSKLPINDENIVFYDIDNNKINSSNYVELSQVSDNIINSFIAIEDKRFYKHKGIDTIRILGAMKNNIKSGNFSEGASTITCQLVKNTQLSSEKTLKRKLQEAKIALEIEKNYSKNQILEMYLNELYFGNGIYGIKNACQSIFNKKPSEITLAEATALAATVVNPSQYAPQINIENNTKRRYLILDIMKKQKMISTSIAEAARQDIIVNYSKFHNNNYENYTKSALFEAKTLVNDLADNKRKVKVYTYLNPQIQDISALSISNQIDGFCQNGDKAASQMILLDNVTRGIIAYSANNSKVNAFSLSRQPGSTIKPIIYSAGMEKGLYIPDSPILDSQKSYNGYNPKNYNNKYLGWTTVENALVHSLNAPSVAILNQTGVDFTYNYARNLGLSLDEKDKNLSLALGGTTYGSKINEIAGAYCAFANEGRYKKPSFIRKITDDRGYLLYQNNELPTQSISQESSFLISSMLKKAATNGTAKQLSYTNIDICAKTGTVGCGNDGNSDAWCAGYTSEHTFVVWFGALDRANPLNSTVTGGNQPCKLAKNTLRLIYKERAPEQIKINIKNTIDIDNAATNLTHEIVQTSPITSKNNIKTIFTTEKFVPKSVDITDYLFKDLQIKSDNYTLSISFAKPDDSIDNNISYELLLNDKQYDIHTIDDKIQFDYIFTKRELKKITLFCKDNNGQELCKLSKLVLIK